MICTGRLEPSLDRPYRPQGASHRSRRPWAGHAGFNLGCYSYPRLVTTLYPVRLEAQNTLNDSIKTIKEHLRKIPNKGVGYGAVMGCEPSVLPNISFNYLGQLGLESQGPDAWTISFEASGTAMPPENALWYDLNLFGSVRAGQLEFTVSGRLK